MTEASAGHTLRGNIKTVFPRAHFQRFEDSMSVGIPDANFCWDGHEVWLEAKKVKAYPKRDTSKVVGGLSFEQRAWLLKREASGGRVYVWCRAPDGWYLFKSSQFRELVVGMTLAEWRACLCFKTSIALLEAIKGELT